jgi:prefoldin beta subunit
MAQQPNQSENEAEKLVRDYQMTQEQLRAAAMQLEQLQTQKAELAKAKDEVGGSTGKVYITVGGVIVETSKEKAMTDIKDKSEFAEVRINSLTKQFNELKAKEKQLGEKLTHLYKQGQETGGVS